MCARERDTHTCWDMCTFVYVRCAFEFNVFIRTLPYPHSRFRYVCVCPCPCVRAHVRHNVFGTTLKTNTFSHTRRSTIGGQPSARTWNRKTKKRDWIQYDACTDLASSDDGDDLRAGSCAVLNTGQHAPQHLVRPPDSTGCKGDVGPETHDNVGLCAAASAHEQTGGRASISRLRCCRFVKCFSSRPRTGRQAGA